MGTPVTYAAEMTGVGAPGGLGAQPHLDRDAVGGKQRMALPRDLRIGIGDGRDHPRDARSDDRVGAGRRLAVMGARLQRHIKRGAARPRPRAA